MIEIHVARCETRNFTFEGVGDSEPAARKALARALRHHQASTEGVEWSAKERFEMVDEANVHTYALGRSYRDGQEI